MTKPEPQATQKLTAERLERILDPRWRMAMVVQQMRRRFTGTPTSARTQRNPGK